MKDCSSFNPLLVDVILKNGLEQVELQYDTEGNVIIPKVICTEQWAAYSSNDWPIVTQLPNTLIQDMSAEDYEAYLQTICDSGEEVEGGVICKKDDGSKPICMGVNYKELYNSEKFLVCGEYNQPIMCGDGGFGFVHVSKPTGPIICHGRNDNGIVVDVKPQIIQLDNFTDTTRLRLQFEDGEIDEYLKIYTNYVRVDDGHGDWHYDLYFNLQNLFNSPFEYISSVTKQPNVLIIPDSYLYLTGDKFKEAADKTHNEIDEDKVKSIQEGGELSIYGQVKTYSDDKLSDARTIKLFSYRVYNVSDDKPKFLIEKTYDITKTPLRTSASNLVKIGFSDVLWTIDENKFKWDRKVKGQSQWQVVCGEDGSSVQLICSEEQNVSKVMCDDRLSDVDKFRELDADIVVIQPINIRYNWNRDDDFRIREISFDIVNDMIDFENTPVLLGYEAHERTLRNGLKDRKPYYDRWSDRYMKIEVDEYTRIPRMTIRYDERCGFNFETIYLKWKLPKGCKLMDTIDRLGGYVFSSTASNVVAVCNNSSSLPEFDVQIGHVVARVNEPGKMYLGLEHSTTQRQNGYVLTGLAESIREALAIGYENPTTNSHAVEEGLALHKAKYLEED